MSRRCFIAVNTLAHCLLFGWSLCVSGPAQAASQPENPCASYGSKENCDQGTAYAIAVALVHYYNNDSTSPPDQTGATLEGPVTEASSKKYQVRWAQPTGIYGTVYYPILSTCAARPSILDSTASTNGSLQCNGGCQYVSSDNGDGTSTAVANGSVCTPTPAPLIDPEKNNQCDV